jgi:threonine aldolase
LAPPYTGIAPAHYAALFDTVYVSLYKYLGAGSGAILAGSRALLASIAPVRHQMGGLVFGAWMSAAVALHFIDGFDDRFQRAAAASEQFLRLIARDERVRVERIPAGTNITKAHLVTDGLPAVLKRLDASRILVRQPEKDSRTLLLQFNESILQRSAAELARDFLQALG